MLDVLHWFPLQQRISYRIISLIWRSLLGLAPAYFRDLCHTTMGIPGRRSLRSTEHGLLLIQFAHTEIMQNSAFSVVSPSLWNGLPLGRGVQYVHWVMHKCIMVKVGGKRNTRKVCKKQVNLSKRGGKICQSRGK